MPVGEVKLESLPEVKLDEPRKRRAVEKHAVEKHETEADKRLEAKKVDGVKRAEQMRADAENFMKKMEAEATVRPPLRFDNPLKLRTKEAFLKSLMKL